MEEAAYAIGWVIIFILSATVHEAAHAWTAKRGGDLTAYSGGQVSLDPWPHIKRSPLGMVVIPLVSAFLIGWPFGYASTPFDPVWAHTHPRKAAWMSAAGPAANLMLVLICVMLIKVGILSGVFAQPDSVNLSHIVDATSPGIWNAVSIFLSMFFTLNLILAVINVMPVPPLDGSGIITLFMKEDTARSYKRAISNPAFGFIGFFLVWQFISPVIDWAFPSVINLLYWGSHYR